MGPGHQEACWGEVGDGNCGHVRSKSAGDVVADDDDEVAESDEVEDLGEGGKRARFSEQRLLADLGERDVGTGGEGVSVGRSAAAFSSTSSMVWRTSRSSVLHITAMSACSVA